MQTAVSGLMSGAPAGSLMGGLVPPKPGSFVVGSKASGPLVVGPLVTGPLVTGSNTRGPMVNNFQPSAVTSGGGIVPPSQQLQVVKQHTGLNVQQNRDVGPVVLDLHAGNVQPVQGGALFFKQYQHPQIGQANHAQALTNRDSVFQQLPSPPTGKCTVFPPLLVRFAGHKDTYIPVQVLSGGEIHDTAQIPDFIMNFHRDTGAITLTVCDIPKQRYFDFEIAVTALYALQADQPLSLNEITALYDQNRMKVLEHLKQAALAKKFEAL